MQLRLICSTGSSHKEYNVWMSDKPEGFTVDFSYGRVGSTLKYGTKTTAPVDKTKAIALIDKLQKQKQAKGYVVDSADGQHNPDIIQTQPSPEVVMLPQLANAVSKDQIKSLLHLHTDMSYQIKYDGERRIIGFQDGVVFALNRRGQKITANPDVMQMFEQLCLDAGIDSVILDGEDMGGSFRVFDIVEYNHSCLKPLSFLCRQDILREVYTLFNECHHLWHQHLLHVETWRLHASYLDSVIDQHKHEEGIIIRLDAPYVEGRPHSGGSVLKYKNVHDLSALVTHVNEQRSVSVSLFDGETLIEMGNVTIPPNASIPQTFDVIDVRYLWALPKGKLIQPVYLRNRTGEILHKVCVIDQVHYKSV